MMLVKPRGINFQKYHHLLHSYSLRAPHVPDVYQGLGYMALVKTGREHSIIPSLHYWNSEI